MPHRHGNYYQGQAGALEAPEDDGECEWRGKGGMDTQRRTPGETSEKGDVQRDSC